MARRVHDGPCSGGFDAGDGLPVVDFGAVRRGDFTHCRHGAFGVDDTSFGMEQDGTGRAVEGEAGPAFGGLGGCEQFGGNAAGCEHGVQFLGVAGAAVVEAAGDAQQRGLELRLKLPPELPSQAGHRDVERIRVGAAEDPGAAMRTAPRMPGLERLEYHDRPAASCQRPGGRGPGKPGPDDDDIHPLCTHSVPPAHGPTRDWVSHSTPPDRGGKYTQSWRLPVLSKVRRHGGGRGGRGTPRRR